MGQHTFFFFPIVPAAPTLHLVKPTCRRPSSARRRQRADAEAEMVADLHAYTFLIYSVSGLGTTGMLIYALVIGLGSGVAYGRMRRRPDDPGRIMRRRWWPARSRSRPS